MNTNDARRAHRIMDTLCNGNMVLDKELEFLRSFLPERPKQKTLEEIAWDMHFAWSETFGNDWKEELFGDLESWLTDLHTQLHAHLEGVKSQAHPALPDGMRIAEHENFGRVVVSPGVGIDRCHEIFYLDPGMSSGTDISEVEPDSLTFLDSEPAKPAHPEFLETEGDYASAPKGTIAAKDGWLAWLKETDGVWSCGGSSDRESDLVRSGKRRVLRWSWGNE